MIFSYNWAACAAVGGILAYGAYSAYSHVFKWDIDRIAEEFSDLRNVHTVPKGDGFTEFAMRLLQAVRYIEAATPTPKQHDYALMITLTVGNCARHVQMLAQHRESAALARILRLLSVDRTVSDPVRLMATAAVMGTVRPDKEKAFYNAVVIHYKSFIGAATN